MNGTRTGHELFALYQMGSSEDYVWYSVTAVFFSEDALRDYSKKRGIENDLQRGEPGKDGNVVLQRPSEFVFVRCFEGDVPDVELSEGATE